ncbi:homeobox protein ceh-30-like [Hydractinia symbiolongicarpus]|uniref:homeobox protein ceh-30-like n=1 Tax=Hydractinia symbiolongicarpus TaxID=13093 RepID=UPI00254D2706|nr:homeobox protein ceh-30-like [Hydractinia symbiolongicarpus]
MKRSITKIWRPYEDLLDDKQHDDDVEKEVSLINFHSDTHLSSYFTCANVDYSFRPITSYTASETSSMNSSRCSDVSISPDPPSSLEDLKDDKPQGDTDRHRRTKYSDAQLSELHKVFYTTTYLTLKERYELANRLKLTERQVKNWFQNRRMKAKRDYIDAIEKGYVVPVENPGLPRFSRLPENYFLSYPTSPTKRYLRKF